MILSFHESKFSIFNSFTTFLDFGIMILTIVLGCYTLFLAIQTIWFQKHESSLVDSMKLEKMTKRPVMFRRELAKYAKDARKRRTLSWSETIEAVFGESTLFTLNILNPNYSRPEERTLEYVTKQYLLKKQAE